MGLARRALARDSNSFVREELASNVCDDPEILGLLSQDPQPDVRRLAVSNSLCPQEVVIRASRDLDVTVRCAAISLVQNPPAEIWARWAADVDHRALAAAASRRDCPEPVLRQLAANPHEQVQIAVTSNPQCPAELLQQAACKAIAERKYAAVPRTGLLVAVASSANCPPAVLGQLAQLDDSAVRAAVAGNCLLPAGNIQELARRSSLYEKVLGQLAGRPDCPAQTLGLLATSWAAAVRETVASHPGTTSETLRRMCRDTSSKVRSQVAANPNTPREALGRLIRDSNSQVAQRALHNPNADPGWAVMWQFVQGWPARG
jgi:hypothetical protein